MRTWLTARDKAFCAHVVSYADDFVILSSGVRGADPTLRQDSFFEVTTNSYGSR